MWYKENMINLAISKLPENWKYVAWIDPEVEFTNINFVKEAIEKFEKYTVVQLFQQANILDESGNLLKSEESFGYFNVTGRPISTKLFKTSYPNPGYAWAMSRKIMEKLGGIIDFDVAGGAELHMAFGFLGRIEECIELEKIESDYAEILEMWQEKAIRFIEQKVGYVEGRIRVSYDEQRDIEHTDERWQILNKHGFDPRTQLYKDDQGLWAIHISHVLLQADLVSYFISLQKKLNYHFVAL